MEYSKQNRRTALTAILKATAAAFFIPAWNESIEAATATCSLTTPDVTEGPYWVDEQLFRSDIRTDPSTGVIQAGVPLTVAITAINSSAGCAPLAGAYIDVWHCGATGIYSDESTYIQGGDTGNVTTTGQKFLRAYQIANSNGQVTFNLRACRRASARRGVGTSAGRVFRER
jgi:protocatechuate 3,4-dioxygenase beta subunit